MGLYELNKKLKIARQRGFIYIQIKKTNNKTLFTPTIYNFVLLFKISYSINAPRIF